ncbi:M20 family metallopeptidase [Rhizobium sp. TRM96647]|uniref:M20 aminoacylase family protein n=1 Tax=unclassified Rhizobium TaxID=2613769 RepID=UPI0021E7459B|nr:MULTISPECIES: M20 aminoacylase family protein [unclassified Rhizobium]MCV3734665.1 M20 family metallopeptidase [Rhizobium sp. TRM96647]MCV3757035.1 M20 family metallopeptidase [Rhizobium sp. TRM96650]
MPVLNRAAELQDEIAGWRRQIHQHPETMFAVEKTAAFVADKLKAFGVDEIVTGIGRTGVVGLIRGKAPGYTIGLRADMDALPINEESGKPWASTVAGKMHACGHDGHTAMLLGAAKYLAETRNFAGSVAVIFQPAEEGGGGGREMVRDGMMDRFGITEVYGMHNMPGMPVGRFGTRIGAIMAATDEFDIHIKGRGGHAAQPHRTTDTIVLGSQIVGALQTIVARNTDPIASLVVSVTKFNAGFAYNVIPETATLSGTVRTLSTPVREEAEARIRQICAGLAAAHGAEITVRYQRNYPVVVNHAAETGHAVAVAEEIAGKGKVDAAIDPMMGGEDFAYMLEARPGAFVFMGNGDTAGLHHPAYDFNDDAIPHGVSYWVKLVETRLPA